MKYAKLTVIVERVVNVNGDVMKKLVTVIANVNANKNVFGKYFILC